VSKKIILTLVYTPIFYFIVFPVCKYFLRNTFGSRGEVVEMSIENHFKHDLILAAILYTVCVVLYYYPVIIRMGDVLIGGAYDNVQNFWNMWWAEKVVMGSGISFDFSQYIHYPQGSSLVYLTYSFYNLFFAIPLRRIFTPVTVYNLLVFQSYILSGIGAFLLIKYLLKDSALAIIGGFLFAFNPSHFAHAMGHMQTLSIQFIPFFVLTFIRAVNENSKKHLILSCVFFLLNTLCSWYYMVFALYFMVLYGLYIHLREKQIFIPGIFNKILIIAGSTVLILSPWIIKMVYAGLKYPASMRAGHNYYVVDIFALFIPNPYNQLGRLPIFKYFNDRFTGNNVEMAAYLGMVNIFVVIAAFKGTIKKTAKYFCAFLLFVLLAMGTYLHVLGNITSVLLPYRVIQAIPFFGHVRTPSRCIVYAYLFWAVIVCYGLKYLFARLRPGISKKIISTVVLVLIFFDFYTVNHVATSAHLPYCYGVIMRDSGQYGILDLPMAETLPGRYMMYQTCHGKPIVQGYVSRKLEEVFIDQLELKDITVQEKQLRKNQVKYIVIHKRYLPVGESLDTDRYREIYENIYEDGENIVFKVY